MTLFALVLVMALTAAACGGGSSGGNGSSAGGGKSSGGESPSEGGGDKSGGGDKGGGGEKGGGGSLTIMGADVPVHGTADASSGELSVELDDNYFEPTVITGKPGQKVKLELENEGQVQHNLAIESEGIDEDVAAGQKVEVTVTMPKSGSLPFTCKYHTALGMSGLLKAG
ncbi:hypothetical protein BH18ACT15_BH18ACT15_15130 [soil metagenome]